MGAATIEYRSTRDILTKATGFMDAYDFTLNPYTGCAFGCTYCYAAFFSRGLDSVSGSDRGGSWGRWVEVKENAVSLLEARRSSLDGKRIYMSTVTDPYQPLERKLEITRNLLSVLAERHRPKLVVQTRSPDVLRDVELFQKIAERGGQVQVNLTVTTDDEKIRREFEPWCPSNGKRLLAAKTLAENGIETCVTMTPLLLIRDAKKFAEDLLTTGVKKFIIQPFHLQRGKFVAGTRETALKIMAERLSCDRGSIVKRYQEQYDRVRTVLSRELPSLGEGKAGFEPPF
ncbi:MAG: radical SAM protein [Rhodobacteraceae bacterium]|nr:radical SAM protein [Paracoccaceae bacterium]